MDPLDIALVGPGRLGSALLHHLAASPHRCRVVRARRPEPGNNIGPVTAIRDTWDAPRPWPPVDLVLLSVPDRAVGEAARRLTAGGVIRKGLVVLHTSGPLTSEVLDPCRRAGAAVGSWHPLQSFPSGGPPPPLDGVLCAVEGDPAAVETGERLAADLGMTPWRIAPGDKALYHAAVSLAANMGHVLVVEARRLLEAAGLERDHTAGALAPLMRASLEAALAARGYEALTGPAARGDVAVVRRHLEVLPPRLSEAYAALWHHLVESGAVPGNDPD